MAQVLHPTTRRTRPGRVHWPMLAAFIAGATISGALAGVATRPDEWYDALDKAPLNPPSGVFGPVWTVLYVLIGIAGYLAWAAPTRNLLRSAMALWVGQLVLNLAWTPIFFGAHRPGWALAEMIVLLVVIGATIGVFSARSRTAAMLLVPYAMWVMFATYLTAYIVANN